MGSPTLDFPGCARLAECARGPERTVCGWSEWGRWPWLAGCGQVSSFQNWQLPSGRGSSTPPHLAAAAGWSRGSLAGASSVNLQKAPGQVFPEGPRSP